MKSFITLALALLVYSYSFANEKEAIKNAGKVTGKVIEKKSATPVSFATVALISETDSALVAGVITGEDGEFEIVNIPFGTYDLRISFVGYKPVRLEDLVLNRKNSNMEIPTEELALEEAITTLEEVAVVRERLKGEEKIDRTVFTINDDIRNSASSGLDLLKSIPSVTVDFQDNVTLEGQSNIQFYVDGILRKKDFVAQIDPKSIDKVEIVSNPGVKYNADVSGVINIVLKKEKRYGVNGSVLLPLVHPTKVVANPKANIEYGNQNFRVYVGDRLHHERFTGKEYLTTELDDSNPDPYRFEKVRDGKMRFQNNYLNYGADWFINDKTTLNFLGEYVNNGSLRYDMHSKNTTWREDVVSDYNESELYKKNDANNYYFSLFLKRKFSEESELTAEGYMYLHSSEDKNRYADVYYETPDAVRITDEITRNNNTNNFSKTAEFRLDYNFTSGQIKHEMGLREYKQWMDNDFTNRFSLESITNENQDNFTYTEHRQAAYYNLMGKVNKISWQAGIRGEHSGLNIQDTTNTGYFVFLPQFSLSYSMENQQSLKFSFRRQIHRPWAQAMNPFENWIDSLHVRRGNPDLKPAYQTNLELTYSKNIGSNYISPKIYYTYMADGIQDLSVVNNEGVSVLSNANIGKEIEYGVSLNASVQPVKWLRLNANTTLYERKLSTTQGLALEKNNQKVSYRVNGQIMFLLPKDFSIVGVAQYNSPNIKYQRVMTRDALYLFGIEKKVNNNLSIEAMYNPFIKDFKYQGIVTKAPGYYESWKGVLDVQHLFAIEISYSFNTGKKINKLNRSADYNRQGGGGAL